MSVQPSTGGGASTYRGTSLTRKCNPLGPYSRTSSTCRDCRPRPHPQCYLTQCIHQLLSGSQLPHKTVNLLVGNSKQLVHGFVGELSFSNQLINTFRGTKWGGGLGSCEGAISYERGTPVPGTPFRCRESEQYIRLKASCKFPGPPLPRSYPRFAGLSLDCPWWQFLHHFHPFSFASCAPPTPPEIRSRKSLPHLSHRHGKTRATFPGRFLPTCPTQKTRGANRLHAQQSAAENGQLQKMRASGMSGHERYGQEGIERGVVD